MMTTLTSLLNRKFFSRSRLSNDASRIRLEEKIYRDIFPAVRLYQGYWMSATAIFFFLMALIPLFNWSSFRRSLEIAAPTQRTEWSLIGETVLMLAVYTGVSIWLGVAICRMRKWVGVLALLYCVPALSLTTLGVVFAIFESVRSWIIGDDMRYFLTFFLAIILIFSAPFGYLCFFRVFRLEDRSYRQRRRASG